MISRCLPVLLLVLFLGVGSSFCYAANPVKMRPYSGIGVVLLSGVVSGQEPQHPVYLYREPGLFRLGALAAVKLSGNEWVFGPQADHFTMVVMAREDDWLRVCYDDAGREAWIKPQRRDQFFSWDEFWKSRMSRLLPGLRKQYYQLYLQPEQNPDVMMTSKQPFKVLKLQNDWAMVLRDPSTIGWLRWRDEDGRLTIGLE